MAQADKIKTILPEGRLAFPSIFKKAKAFKEGGFQKYEGTVLWGKKTDLKAVRALCDQAAIKRWGKIPKGLKLPFRDGNEKEQNGFADTTYARFNTSYAPPVIDRDKVEITNEEDLYAGCYIKASVLVETYEQTDEQKRVLGRGVKFVLRSIMKTKEGEPLVVRANAAEDFDQEGSDDASNYQEPANDDVDLSDLGL